MPLFIIKQDITKIKCDAIVNTANKTLLGGGGVDGAIHKAAGAELLQECKSLGGCETGKAKITKGYNLPSKFVIHTVGPIWQGGEFGEKQKLISCYKNSLALAKKYSCETIAFPLISSGFYGYPKDKALRVAVKTIKEFLFDNEMTVYLTIFDKTSFKIGRKLYYDLKEYLFYNHERQIDYRMFDMSLKSQKAKREKAKFCESLPAPSCDSYASLSLIDAIKNIDDNFAVTLLKLIELKGMTDVECYKKANVSKQTWYKIMNEKEYRPSKNTVIAFAIALELSLEETNQLLATVGYTLSKSIKFDVIIEYFIINGKYDIFTINEALFEFDQVCLGV